MGTLTNDSTKATEFAGEYKMWSFNNLAVGTASDTLTLTFAANCITEIQNTIVSISAGQDEEFTYVASDSSGLIVTITSVEQDGTAAIDFTGTKVNLLIIGK